MSQYLGFVALQDMLPVYFPVKNTSGVPTDPAALPTYRVYGGSGLMTGGTGSAAKRDTGTITGATNASPIVISSAGHGLETGVSVTVANVGVNTAANGVFTVTKVSASTFSLDGSSGNGIYSSGGTWHTSGLYGFSLIVSAANGYEKGQTYTILVEATVGGSVWAETLTFTVV